jgi:protein-tyrosine phosphatase
MNNSSYFIDNKCLFGSFPKQDTVNILEENNVRYFIDLTYENEKNTKTYTTQYNYINYPIKDMSVPTNWQTYSCFIIAVINIIKNLEKNEKVYIHCKGGHGRSGVVVASILCYMYNMDPLEAIEATTIYHNNRNNMRQKWRNMGSPQTLAQKKFVINFFKPIYIQKLKRQDILYGLTNQSSCPVYIDNLGLFPNVESALQSYKNPFDKEYVRNQQLSKTYKTSIELGNNVEINENWRTNYKKYMIYIIKLKMIQHPVLKEQLLYTGLRPFIDNNSDMLSDIITKLREVFYTEIN